MQKLNNCELKLKKCYISLLTFYSELNCLLFKTQINNLFQVFQDFGHFVNSR